MTTMPKGYARRDGWIAKACDLLLRCASPKYRAMIGGAISYGLKSAAADARSPTIVFDHVKGEVRREPYYGMGGGVYKGDGPKQAW